MTVGSNYDVEDEMTMILIRVLSEVGSALGFLLLSVLPAL